MKNFFILNWLIDWSIYIGSFDICELLILKFDSFFK